MKKLFILFCSLIASASHAEWQLKRNTAAYGNAVQSHYNNSNNQQYTQANQVQQSNLSNEEYVRRIPEHDLTVQHALSNQALARQQAYNIQAQTQQVQNYVQHNILQYDPNEAFVRPVGYEMNSPYGYRFHPIDKKVKFHSGLDFAAPKGTPIRAARSGYVIFSGRKGGYGNAVIIRHDNRFATLYGHASALHVKVGQRIERGQVIAAVGSTGKSTGNHLHFEILDYGLPVNPMAYIKNNRFVSY